MKRRSIEKQREESRKAQEEHKLREERFRKQKEQQSKQKQKIIGAVAVLFLLIISWVAYGALSPGKYDEFAKCLTEKGAVMYGEDWCPYTQAQKNMFGKSFKHIDYHVKPDLKVRPTWIIDGKTYETVQSFEHLSALTGCKF